MYLKGKSKTARYRSERSKPPKSY